MPIITRCPSGCRLKVPQKLTGQEIVCPNCNVAFAVSNELVLDSPDPGESPDEIIEFEIETSNSKDVSDAIEIGAICIDIILESNQKSFDWLQLRSQLRRSMEDRIVVARFIAILLFAVGLLNIVPAIYHWYAWTSNPVATDLPRWIFVIVFVAVLHLLYSLFVLQVVDWSALRAIAFVALIFAAVFGFVFTELVLSQIESKVAAYLKLPWSLLRTAITWSAAMLLLELITCYLAAKESFHWQRVECLSLDLGLESLGGGNDEI